MSANIPSMGEETRAYLESIYASEYEEMRRLAYHESGRSAHIVDPSQAAVETLVRAAIKRAQFQGSTPAQFRTWLKTILVNEVINALRRAERRLRTAQDVDGYSLDRHTTAAGPAEVSEQSDNLAAVYRAMEQLSERDREVLALVYRSDLSQDLCAELLGISYDAFRAHLSRAKVKLRELLDCET